MFQPGFLLFISLKITILKRNCFVSFLVLMVQSGLFAFFPKYTNTKAESLYFLSDSFLSIWVFRLFPKYTNTKAELLSFFSHSFVSIQVVRLFSKNGNTNAKNINTRAFNFFPENNKHRQNCFASFLILLFQIGLFGSLNTEIPKRNCFVSFFILLVHAELFGFFPKKQQYQSEIDLFQNLILLFQPVSFDFFAKQQCQSGIATHIHTPHIYQEKKRFRFGSAIFGNKSKNPG